MTEPIWTVENAALDDTAPLEIWRGVVEAWECDEMGHMNVRFYVAKAMQGLAGLARRLGKAHAFASRATATLAVREHHVRFLSEARAGDRLVMRGGVVAMGVSDAVILQLLQREPGGDLCAGVVSRVEHVDPREQRPFAWPERSRHAAEQMRVDIPPQAQPRQLLAPPSLTDATLARADALGLACHARSVVTSEGCDVFGRLAPQGVVAALSVASGGLMEQVRSALREVPKERAIGAAALEYRIAYAAMPSAGDHLEVRSGFAAVGSKVQQLSHWLLDPVSGRAWARADTVVAAFDIAARKIAPLPLQGVEALQAQVVAELLTP